MAASSAAETMATREAREAGYTNMSHTQLTITSTFGDKTKVFLAQLQNLRIGKVQVGVRVPVVGRLTQSHGSCGSHIF